MTFDLCDPLVSNTPNDGAHMVILPSTTSATARLMLKGRNNVFFDISNQNLSIATSDPGKVIPNDTWYLISLPSIPPAGANTVGDPFFSALAMDSMRVSTTGGICGDTDGCTLTEANTSWANVMNDMFYTWNGGPSYVPVSSGATWDVWTGYWVAALPGANGLSPVLRVPRN